jgi:hypothetical protein
MTFCCEMAAVAAIPSRSYNSAYGVRASGIARSSLVEADVSFRAAGPNKAIRVRFEGSRFVRSGLGQRACD